MISTTGPARTTRSARPSGLARSRLRSPFVTQIGFLAEAAAHHPDIDIRWRRVTLALTTHDSKGLTDKDFDLAAQIDEIL